MPAAIDWTEILEDTIAKLLVNGPLRKVCSENPDLPCRNSITSHMVESESFWAKCARARRARAIQRLEDSQAELDDADAKEVTQPGVKLLELRLGDARWHAERILSKDYGSKTQTEVTGKDGGVIQIVSTIPCPPKDE